MNVYEWMDAEESGPPLHEDDTREDPGHRPQVPTEDGDDTNRQHHGDDSPAGGGRSTEDDDEMHCTEHTIQDPHMFEDDLTASNESIIEDVRKFFKFHNRGKDFVELDGDDKANIGKIFRTIEGTFANKEWVAKQTPIAGEIKVGDLADRLNISKPVDTIKETAAINDSFQEAVIAAQLTTVKLLLPYLKLWTPGKLTDAAYEKTKAALSDIKSMPEIVKKPTRAKTNLLDGKTTDEKKAPLTPEETVELAGVILAMMKIDAGRVGEANENISNLLGGFWEAVSDIRREGAHSESYNNEAWDALSQAVFRKLPASIPESMAVFRQFESACIAAVVYMERSFKGGKKVSNEEFTVSCEGLFDKLFKKQQKSEEKPPVKIEHLKEGQRFIESGPATLPAVELSAKLSSWFCIDGDLVDDVVSAVQGDIKEYKRIFGEARKISDQYKAHEKKYAKQLDSFCGDADRKDEFMALLRKMISDQPKAHYRASFRTNHPFLGFDDGAWFDSDEMFNGHPNQSSVGAVTVPAADERTVKGLKNALKTLVTEADKMYDYEYDEAPLGYDMTDAPFRGYSRDDEVIDLMNKLTSDHYELYNGTIGALTAVTDRMMRLFEGLVEYTLAAGGTVSTEGFMDSIKKLFTAKPDGLDVKGIDLRLKKEFEKTILNDAWLKSQKLKPGKVTVRFPDAAMDGNYKPLVAKIKQELQSTAAANKKASDKWYNKIAQGVDLICSGNVKGANLEHVQKLNKIVVYDDLDFKIAYSEPSNITEDDAEVELDALDIAGIKDAARAILDLLDARNKYVTESFGSMPLQVTNERLHLIAKVDGEVKEELHKLRMEVEDIQNYFVESFYQDQYMYYTLVDGLAMPLARWIQQSISGVTVSNEDFGTLGKH